MRTLGRLFLLAAVGVLFITALNVTARGLSSLTLQEQGPVLAWSYTKNGQATITWLGTTHQVETRKVVKTYTELKDLVERVEDKARKEWLPALRASARDTYRFTLP